MTPLGGRAGSSRGAVFYKSGPLCLNGQVFHF
jgi:hypothetical protein